MLPTTKISERDFNKPKWQIFGSKENQKFIYGDPE